MSYEQLMADIETLIGIPMVEKDGELVATRSACGFEDHIAEKVCKTIEGFMEVKVALDREGAGHNFSVIRPDQLPLGRLDRVSAAFRGLAQGEEARLARFEVAQPIILEKTGLNFSKNTPKILTIGINEYDREVSFKRGAEHLRSIFNEDKSIDSEFMSSVSGVIHVRGIYDVDIAQLRALPSRSLSVSSFDVPAPGQRIGPKGEPAMHH